MLVPGTVISGSVIGYEGPPVSPEGERTYTVTWEMPDGTVQTMPGCGVRAMGSPVHRTAWNAGTPVFGLVRTGGAGLPFVQIMDREELATC